MIVDDACEYRARRSMAMQQGDLLQILIIYLRGAVAYE